MTTLDIASPYQHSIHGLRELLHALARRPRSPAAAIARQQEAVAAQAHTAGLAPRTERRVRWTRDVENPFDVPKRLCSEAIR